MGHRQTKSIKLLEEHNFIEVSRWMKSTTVCISFQLRKSYKLPFSLRNKTSSKPLDKIHCDLWGGGGGGGGLHKVIQLRDIDIMLSLWMIILGTLGSTL